MKITRKLIIVFLLLSAVAFARRRDPLTDAESDQLREARQEPAKVLKLFGKFADARLDAINESLNNTQKTRERPATVHDLLDDFASIVDEINDNLDMYQENNRLDNDQRKQYRKGLKELIVDEGKLRARLRSLQHDVENDPKLKAESQAYIFALQDADAALKNSLETAKQYLTEKEEEKPQKK